MRKIKQNNKTYITNSSCNKEKREAKKNETKFAYYETN